MPSFKNCAGIPVDPFTKNIDYLIILEAENGEESSSVFSGQACKLRE